MPACLMRAPLAVLAAAVVALAAAPAASARAPRHTIVNVGDFMPESSRALYLTRPRRFSVASEDSGVRFRHRPPALAALERPPGRRARTREDL